MYDKYPEHDVPQQNIIQRFFSQRGSAIVLEIAMAIVISVAAGQAFDLFGPIDAQKDNPPQEQALQAALPAPAPHAVAGIPLDVIKAYGMDYIRQGQYAKAEAMYDLVIGAEPGDAENYAWRGYANIQAGDYLGARRDYSALVEMMPNHFDGHNSLCWAYGELRQFDEALEHCQRALELAVSSMEYMLAYENRCWVYVEMREYEAAASDCGRVFEIQPICVIHEVCALAHFNIGRILMAWGETDAAIGRFNCASALGSGYADMYLDIAAIYDKLGYETAARANYEKYVELAGKNANPVVQLRISDLQSE